MEKENRRNNIIIQVVAVNKIEENTLKDNLKPDPQKFREETGKREEDKNEEMIIRITMSKMVLKFFSRILQNWTRRILVWWKNGWKKYEEINK